MNTEKTPLQLAQERMAELRREAAARGEKLTVMNPIEAARANPKSKSRAILAYYWDLDLIEQNKGSADANVGEMRRQARANHKAAIKNSGGPAKAIKAICYHCVGGVDSVDVLVGEACLGGEVGGRPRVRNCQVTECALHPHRPWQKIRSRPDAGDSASSQAV